MLNFYGVESKFKCRTLNLQQISITLVYFSNLIYF